MTQAQSTEKCRACGEQASVCGVGDVYEVTCQSCGATYAYHQYSPRDPLPPEPVKSVQVRIKWRGRSPSHKELKILKEFMPRLAMRPIASLFNEYKDQAAVTFEMRSWAEAKRAQSEALKRGVDLDSVESDD